MPLAASRVCTRHKKIKIEKNKPCPLCVKEKNEKARVRGRQQKTRVYDTQLWRKKIRPGKLAVNPLCEQCEAAGRVVVASEVDHITPIEAGGDPYDFDNLRSLCKPCHSRKTATEDGGFGLDKKDMD